MRLVDRFQTLSPSKSPVNKKRKLEYFDETIRIRDIPWSDGLKMTKDECSWRIKVVGRVIVNGNGGDVSSSNAATFQPVMDADELSDLMLVLFYKTLSGDNLRRPAWSGLPEKTFRSGLACLKPNGVCKDWSIADAEAIFTLHKVSAWLAVT